MVVKTVFLCLVLTTLIFGITCKQDIPFNPIHPASVHADHFSPLNNDGVQVDDFLVGDFTSFLLDFSTLTSATPVGFDLAGGATFNSREFEVSGNGPISIETEVNDLNIEARSGEVRFQGEDLALTSYGTDITLESVNGDVYVNTERGDLSVVGSSLNIQGNFNEDGINLSSNGAMTFTAGTDIQLGNMLFNSRDMNIHGDIGFLASADSDMFFYALDKLDVDSDGPMNIGSTDILSIYSLSGDMNVESSHLDIQSPDFLYNIEGSATMSSVLDYIYFTASSSINANSADQVKFTSNEDGIHLVAESDINFIGGNAIELGTSYSNTSRITMSSDDILIESQLDSVSIHAQENLAVKVSNEFLVDSDQNAQITAQNSLSVTSTGAMIHDIDRKIVMKVDNEISFDGGNGNMFFDIDDDLFIISTDSNNFIGGSITMTITDDADFNVHSDINFEISDTLTFNFENEGTFSGESEIEITSSGDALFTTDSILMKSGGSVLFSSDDSDISTNDGDIEINSSLYSSYLSNDLTINSDSNFDITSDGDMSITSNTELNINAGIDVTISSTLDSQMYFHDLFVNAGNDVELQFGRDLQMFILDEFTMTIEDFNPSDIFLQSGDNFRLESGDLTITGQDFNLQTTDLHIFARVSFSLSSLAELSFDVSNEFDISSDANLSLTSGGKMSFTAESSDLFFIANHELMGDISFISDNSISLDSANEFDNNADRFEMFGSSISITGSSEFSIYHERSSDFRNIDYGNTLFSSNSTLDINSDTFNIDSRSIEYYAWMNFISDSNSITIQSTSNEDVFIQSGNNVNFTSFGDTSIFSSTIDIFSVESSDIQAETIDITGNTLSISILDDISFSAKEAIDVTSSSSIDSFSSNLVHIIGGNIDVNAAGNLNILERGDGTEFNAGQAISLSMANMISNAGENIWLTAKSNQFTHKAITLTSSGGEHWITSQDSYSLSSGNTIDFTSNDNGFIAFNSGKSISQTAGLEFSLSGQTNSLTTSPSRFGTIRSTPSNGHICVNSNNVDETGFFGDSIDFTASGPNAELNVKSSDFMIFNTFEGSVGMNAFGFIPTDPQFLFEPDVSYGILYRTVPDNTNPITLTSSSDIASFAKQRFYISSNSSTLLASAGEELEIRTYAENANLNIVTDNGDLGLFYADGGFFTAGNPLLQANLLATATRDIIWTSSGLTEWNHLGTSTADSNLGILFESFETMTYTTNSGSYVMQALDGGLLSIETRDGDISFESTTNSIEFLADTGFIDMFARGNNIFTSTGGDIDLSGNGDGGSVYLSSGGEQLFSILATDTKLFFTADNGEIDFEAAAGIFATVTDTNTYTGPCINVEGGSILYNATTLINFTSEDEISLDSEVEFTVDSDNIDFLGENMLNIRAGGTTISPGISVNSVGDIVYTSGGDTTFNATNVLFTINALTMDIDNDIRILSTFDSLLQDSIILSAQNAGATFDSNSQRYTATLEQTTTSSSLNTLITSSIDLISSHRELDINSQTSWINTIIGGDYTFTGGDIDVDIFDYSITSNVDGISFHADSSLTLNTNDNYQLITDTLSYIANGMNNKVYFDNEDSILITATNNFVSNVFEGLTEIYSVDDILITSATTTTFSAYDDILSTSFGSLDFSIANNYIAIAEYFFFDVDGFISELQDTTTISAANYENFAFGDIAYTADTSFDISADTNQPIRFVSNGDIDIETTTFTGTGGTYSSFTATQDRSNGVDIDVTTLDVTTTDATYTSKRDVLFTDSSTDYSFNFDPITFTSFGHGGVQFIGTDFTSVSTGITSFTSSSGNIEADLSGLLTVSSSDLISITTYHDFGDIIINSGTDINFFGNSDIIIQQFSNSNIVTPSTKAGDGFISLRSPSINVVSADLFSASSDNNLIIETSGDALSTLQGANLNIESGFLTEFYGHEAITVTATDDISFNTLGNPGTAIVAEIRKVSNNILVDATTSFTIDASSSASVVSSGTIIFENDVDLTLQSGRDIIMATNRGDIEYLSTDDVYTVFGDFTMMSQGTEGVLAIDSPSTSFAAGPNSVSYTAHDSIYAPFSAVTGDDISIESAKDIVLLGQTQINIDTDDILFYAINDGTITINSGGPLTADADDGIDFIARGMLGTIGGRYVLEDSYWFNVFTYDQHHRINRNTNGIEITNINDDLIIQSTQFDVDIYSHQGSVEFRAVAAIRYFNGNSNDEILFFGNLLGNGVHRVVPFAFANDYCATGGCTNCSLQCATLSGVINDIVRALVAYGILECTAGSGFCF